MLLKDKGIAFCGLACCVCGQNETCAGCRNDGCENREWCKNRSCCLEKGLSGCWECPDFPCQDTMLDKMRVRAFARFIREYGEALFKALHEGVIVTESGLQYIVEKEGTGACSVLTFLVVVCC